MAIVKTTITGTTWETQFADVLEWLQTNATGYFDEITGDSSTNTITMAYGDASVIIANKSISVTLANGVNTIGGTYESVLIDEIYKTDSGFYMHKKAGQSWLQVWVTKTNTGNTCVMFWYDHLTSDRGYKWADLTASLAFSQFAANQPLELSSQTFSASLTALTPFVFNGGVYSDSLFIQTFNEYYGISGIFSINKTQYVSNGYIALKD